MMTQLYDTAGKFCADTPDDLRNYLDVAGKRHYVYVLCYPGDGPLLRAFYVGLGQNSRVFAHEKEANKTDVVSYKVRSIREVWRNSGEIVRVIDSLHDEQPFSQEAVLIHELGLSSQQGYSPSNVIDGVELRKYANIGNELPNNFI
jgi:hypothetical protein